MAHATAALTVSSVSSIPVASTAASTGVASISVSTASVTVLVTVLLHSAPATSIGTICHWASTGVAATAGAATVEVAVLVAVVPVARVVTVVAALPNWHVAVARVPGHMREVTEVSVRLRASAVAVVRVRPRGGLGACDGACGDVSHGALAAVVRDVSDASPLGPGGAGRERSLRSQV